MLCNQEACMRSQKLVFVGNKILSYFKQIIGSSSSPDVDIGFEYTVGQTVNALSDPAQRAALNHAIAQQPAGTYYPRYLLTASWVNNTLHLNDDVQYVVPNLGTFDFRINTAISIYNCSSCALTGVTLYYSSNGQTQPPSTLRSQSCFIE
jgi:hypothetical protein